MKKLKIYLNTKMIHNIPAPEVSPDFTIEDIHKIREWNYERLKDAMIEERLADTRQRTEERMTRCPYSAFTKQPRYSY